MKPITKYEANDGSVFNDATSCHLYEAQLEAVAIAAANYLNPIPDTCEFRNGSGFVQQILAGVESFKSAVCGIISTTHKPDSMVGQWAQEVKVGKRHISYLGRLVDDADNRALKNALHRLMCIDSECREWGQPCYAMNTPKEPKPYQP